jgi:prepilin-type processing-associated H-X9-DG protein
MRLEVMLCPSDDNTLRNFTGTGAPGDAPGDWARGNYAANAGANWFNGTLGGHASTSPISYSPSSGGGIFGVNWGVSLAQLAGEDGSSQTIMFNEVRIGLVPVDRRGVWAMGLAASSVTCAHATGDATNPNDTNEYSDDIEDCNAVRTALGLGNSGLGPRRMGCSNDNLPNNWPNWQGEARSNHPGWSVNACFGDGSVRSIGYDINESIWFYMNCRDDGQHVDFSWTY